jgi:hypothetical protein
MPLPEVRLKLFLILRPLAPIGGTPNARCLALMNVLRLRAVPNLLAEDTELVPDSVTDRGIWVLAADSDR